MDEILEKMSASRVYPEANVQNPTVLKIVLAAGECFAKKGYSGTSTREISEKAGVSKSLLHYHFQSKEHILFELESLLVTTIADRIRQATLTGEPSLAWALTTLDKIWGLLRGVRDYIPLAMDLWKLSATEPALKAHQDFLQKDVLELLDKAIRDLLGPTAENLMLPVERAAQLLYAVLPGLAWRYYLDPAAGGQAYTDFRNLLVHLFRAPQIGADKADK